MQYTHLPEVSCFYSESVDPILNHQNAHFEYQMILVSGGEASVTINNKNYLLKKRSLIFISRMEQHQFTFSGKYCRYVASMSSNLIMSNIQDVELVSIFIQHPKDFVPVIDLDDDTYAALLPLFVRLTDEYKNRLSFYVSRSASLIIAILIDLYRNCPNYFPLRNHTTITAVVLNAQRYISTHFHQKVSLSEIAAANYVSTHTLSLAFKEITGSTFKDYLLFFRMMEAKKLLISTGMSVQEIAEHVGYQNTNNFIRIFRSRESTTPLQYRRQFEDLKSGSENLQTEKLGYHR